jgi:cytochrome P450
VQNPETGKPWPDEFLRSQIATFIIAGFDTSTWALT